MFNLEADYRLEEAIEASDVDAIRSAIRAGADVTGRIGWGPSFLWLAAMREDPAVLAAVLEVDHEQVVLDETLAGIVTLDCAPQVRLLLTHGADPNAQPDPDVATTRPIWQCVFARESSPEVLRLLLDHGVDVSLRTDWGDLPSETCSLALQEVFVERGLGPDSGRVSPPPGYVGPWPWWTAGGSVDPIGDYRYAIDHAKAVYRDRANFLVAAEAVVPGSAWRVVDQLWARQLGPDRFEVCCIPYASDGLGLGDIVETTETETCAFLVTNVVQSVGRSTWVAAMDPTGDPQSFIAQVQALGALAEPVSGPIPRGHLVVSADDQTTTAIDDLLARSAPTVTQASRWTSRTGALDVDATAFRWDPP